MTDPANYRRPPFPNRPWIRGKLYDQYASTSILHCDAYVITFGGLLYLVIDWVEGGMTLIARDGYLIEMDGLTPIDFASSIRFKGVTRYWGYSGVPWARLHKRVILIAGDTAQRFNRWARVVTQCHYVRLGEIDTEIRGERNKYVERKPYAPRKARTLPDWL